MKKKIILLTTILALVAIMTAALAACDPTVQLTEMERLQEQYNAISSANSIEQTIEITKGELKQFESEKTYTKTEDGYTIEGREKRLNGLDANEPFTETEINLQAQKAVDAAPTLKLDASCFQPDYRLSETGLIAIVKNDKIKDVFGITGDLRAAVEDLRLELSLTGGRLSSVRINYDSDEGSHVTITLTMSY